VAKLDERLKRAKAFLAIAESKDSKREAYKMAAAEIAAYKQESGCTQEFLARNLKTTKSTISKLLTWYESGFQAETPFLMDGDATRRAAVSHTKRTLREASPKQMQEILADLPDDAVEEVRQAVGRETDRRVGERQERARKGDAERMKGNPTLALFAFTGALGRGRAVIRSIARGYEDFQALVLDEDTLELGRDAYTEFRADVVLALDEVLEGSFDQAVQRLLDGEKEG